MVQYRVINRKDDIPMKIYDITNKENAYNTLLRLSNINELVIQHYLHKIKYGLVDTSIEEMLEKYDVRPTFKKDELICHLQHMTTSANGCEHIKEKGLMDLRITYEDTDSELRQFLDEQGVKIDLPGQRIYFNGEDLGSIECSKKTYSNDPGSKQHKRYFVGFKFYKDFNVCGFLSFNHKSLYGGNVHRRPEILYNISSLIGKAIDDIWSHTHQSYIVKFSVPYKQVTFERGNIDEMELLRDAFYNAVYNDTDEKIVIMNDHIEIPPEDIISIDKFVSPYTKSI